MHLVLLGERVEKGQPLRIAVGAMQVEQGRTLAGAT